MYFQRVPYLVLGISVIKLFLGILLYRDLFLFEEILSAQRARSMELEPRSDTLEIEMMPRVTRKPDHKRVVVVQIRRRADSTAVALGELFLGYTVEGIQECLGYAVVLARATSVLKRLGFAQQLLGQLPRYGRVLKVLEGRDERAKVSKCGSTRLVPLGKEGTQMLLAQRVTAITRPRLFFYIMLF